MRHILDLMNAKPSPYVKDYAPFLDQALQLASECQKSGDVPVGAVILGPDATVVGSGFNTRERDQNPLGHAEINALTQAAQTLGAWRLENCTLVVTLEPCVMCAGALASARIGKVVFGAWDEKAGACGSVWDLVRDPKNLHWVEVVGGIDEVRCGQVLRDFFKERR